MRVLSLLILSLFLILSFRQTQSPHGTGFRISCNTCHSTTGWHLDKEIYKFDHNNTRLPLVGQHNEINCRQCHPSLVFSEAKNNCIDCHKDVHQSTVGHECSRCHTPVTWLVNNVTEIHDMSRFPLLGAHRTADCYDCHKSASLSLYNILSVECIDCHREDYLATTNPNHLQSGFNEDCISCHQINAFQWTGTGFNHEFFPLSLSHSGLKCSDCHITGNYSEASPECNSCHNDDYLATSNPSHTALNFSINCTECHTTNPGWKPAAYTQHDVQSFPIYSGRHRGTWNSCTECHTNPSDYSIFSCLTCHEHNKSEMDSKHNEVNGYSYNSSECLRCHPRGEGDD